MSNIDPSRLGQVQLSGDDLALFLKLFSGEVLTTYAQKVATAGAQKVKSISGGKSTQFIVTGRAGSKRFTIGDNILLDTNNYVSQIPTDEKIVAVDKPIISTTVINDWDEAVAQYSARQPYSEKLAEALALNHDVSALSTMVATARADLTFSHPDYVTDRVLKYGASGLDTAQEVIGALHEASKVMNQNDVPVNGRIAFVDLDTYYQLLYTYGGGASDLNNADYGALASIATATLNQPIAGFEVRMTKNLPNTDKSANNTDVYGTALNDVFGANGHGYNGDFSTTKAICVHPEATGNVKLWDINTQSEYRQELQGYFTLARMSEGHGVLRPECAVELSTATP